MTDSRRKTQKLDVLAAALVFAVSVGVYLGTLAPTVTLIDSGELIMDAWGLDIPHPPGFPLYVLIGWLFAHIPMGNVAQRLNGMSAIFAALTAVAVFVFVRLTLNRTTWPPARPRPQPEQKRGRSRQKRECADSTTRSLVAEPAPHASIYDNLIPSVVAALSLSFSFTLWNWATVAEVYALNTFIIGLILVLLVSWHNRQHHAQVTRPSLRVNAPGLLYMAALLFGLGLGNHHVTILLLGPAILYWVLDAAGWRVIRRREAWIALLFAALGLSVYLYIPWRAAQQPLLSWGNPSTVERFWWHITGKQYQVNLLPPSLMGLLQRLGIGVRLLWRQFTPLGLGLALTGLMSLWRRERRLAVLTAAIVACNVLYTINYDIVPDIDAYYLPTILVMSVWIGWGSWWLWTLLDRKNWKYAVIPSLIALVTLIGAVNYRPNNRRAYYIAADYGRNVLRGIEPHGLLLTDDWELYAPLLYLQHVEGLRPDVAVIDLLLLQNRSWYHDYVARQYPEVATGIQAETAAFLEQLDLFEHGRLTDVGEIGKRYRRLLEALVSRYIRVRPVYVSLRVPGHWREHDVNLPFTIVPEGLAFRLYAQDAPQNPPCPFLETRGLADGSVVLDETALGVRKTYTDMLINRGLYLTKNGLLDSSILAYEQALALDSDNEVAQRLLAQARAATQR